MSFASAKIALVFDWMTCAGGAEKVNTIFHQLFPQAPIFTSIFNSKVFPELSKAAITTSFIQHLPFARQKHQLYLTLMPYAYELFDLSNFDIVISSSHATAKGIITKPETLHICYCHTPMRYAWDDWQTYIREYKMNPLLKSFAKKRLHKLRLWDRLAADRVDHFIANSKTTQQRINKYYRRSSTIIHPPVDISKFKISRQTKGYYLAVGRLTSYKKFDLLIDTFNQIGLPLKIVGTGIMEKELRQRAKSNIELLGHVPDKELAQLYSECEAVIFPQLEDFGIIPLEGMASGRPIIAFHGGGALDTIVEGETGIFFKEQTPHDLKTAIEKYQKNKENFHPASIRRHVAQFSKENFEKTFLAYVEEKWRQYNSEVCARRLPI